MTRQDSFIEARLCVMCERECDAGIGTLGERTLHRIIKKMLEPDATRHEVKLCGSVVVIFTEERVIEVQTRNLYRLLPKLRRLLPTYPITVVYPIPKTKTVRWVDPKTGEFTPARKSPKKGAPRDAIRELYAIREVLDDPNLTILLMFFDVEDYRTLDGWSRDRKRGSTRAERIPLQYCGEELLCGADDYLRLYLPPALYEMPFTTKEYAKAIGLKERYAYSAISILIKWGILEHIENRGRAFLYQLTDKCKQNIAK